MNASLDLFVHRLGLDLLLAEIADALLLLLPLTIGPFRVLFVSNFCCMDSTCDDEDELLFPIGAVVVPPGLEVFILELTNVVGLLELTTLGLAAERKVEAVVEGFTILTALGLAILFLTDIPGFFTVRGDAIIFELDDFDLAAALISWEAPGLTKFVALSGDISRLLPFTTVDFPVTVFPEPGIEGSVTLLPVLDDDGSLPIGG